MVYNRAEEWAKDGINFPDVHMPSRSPLLYGHETKVQMLTRAIGIEAKELGIDPRALTEFYAQDLRKAALLDEKRREHHERKNGVLAELCAELRKSVGL